MTFTGSKSCHGLGPTTKNIAFKGLNQFRSATVAVLHISHHTVILQRRRKKRVKKSRVYIVAKDANKFDKRKLSVMYSLLIHVEWSEQLLSAQLRLRRMYAE